MTDWERVVTHAVIGADGVPVFDGPCKGQVVEFAADVTPPATLKMFDRALLPARVVIEHELVSAPTLHEGRQVTVTYYQHKGAA